MPSNFAFYPYISPIILTDALFISYGGETGTSTAAQRQAAYFLAEYQISQYLKSFLLPTTVTGTFMLHPTHSIQTDWMNVSSVDAITVYSRNKDSSCTFFTTSTCAYLRNASYGLLDIRLVSSCNCAGIRNPYQIEVAYTSGLTSGTVYNSPIMWALALQANVELDELMGESNEPGGVGILEWANQEYREKRMATVNTSFGSTSIANRVARLLSSIKKYTKVGL